MKGTVVEIEEHQTSGTILGAKISNLIFPISPREGDIRELQLGDSVIFLTTREGTADIIDPHPKIGCERER